MPSGVAFEDMAALRAEDPAGFTRRARESMAAHVEAMVGFMDAGAEVFDYGNSIRGEAELAGTSGRSRSPASSPPTSGRCSARARARSAGPRCPATRPTSPRPTGRSSSCSPRTSRWPGGSGWPARRSISRACRPGSAGSATASATRPGCGSMRWSRSGEVQAPIVIGRDHLDCGSVASPYRETEAMVDGSDAIADWPLLNALVNTASGAPGSRIHHGGGVGIGRSIHAGQVCVADGTALAAAEARARAHQRPGHGRDPPRRRRLRPGRRGRGRARRPRPDETRRAPRWDNSALAALLPLGRDETTGGYRRYTFTEADRVAATGLLKRQRRPAG